MLLVIGLGNPGKDYAATRHNVGFRVVEALQKKNAADFGGWSGKFDSLVSEGRIGGTKVALLQPQTYMNDSGTAVAKAAQFWKVASADIIVISDDLDLPLGTVRVRAGGSSGGHNGLKSIIEHLGTQEFPRVRVGIAGTERAVVPADSYVLEPFAAEEREPIAKAIEDAADAVVNEIGKLRE
jgi:PTH1 family peptidyl-tRNA hydrolase